MPGSLRTCRLIGTLNPCQKEEVNNTPITVMSFNRTVSLQLALLLLMSMYKYLMRKAPPT